MKTPRFYQLLDSYGADFSRWPRRDRAEARGLAERDAGCRTALAEAARLDAVLACDTSDVFALGQEEAVAARLRQRVMRAIEPRPLARRMTWTPRRWRELFGPYGMAGACAGTAALALGIWLGWTQTISPDTPSSDLLAALQAPPVIGGLL